jgi:hypothetical protein
MKIRSQKDFFSGLMFACAGAAFAIGALNYNVGTGARMGPGYFPLMLGILLGVMGLVVLVNSLSLRGTEGDTNPVGAIAWKQLGFIIGANLLFGVLLGGMPTLDVPALGLVLAIYALVIVASMAGAQFRFKGSLVLATVLAIGSYLVFIIGLSLQFQVWPSFITG